MGDAFLDRPPYYAGIPGAEIRTRAPRVGHLPVALQQGAAQAPIFDPDLGPELRGLLDGMTRYLDSLGVSRRLVEGGRVSAVTHAATRWPPDVSFGCITPSGAAGDDCAERGDSALGRGRQRMRLAVGRPSADWVAWIGEVMDEAPVDAALVVTLEVGPYLVRQTGLTGAQEVHLGTDRVERLPWLTSLETPVTVLQLTGALAGRDGKALRIGAEGRLARRTPLLASGLGAQRLITDEDLRALATARRAELVGSPLAWQVGLRNLVAGLMGHSAPPAP